MGYIPLVIHRWKNVCENRSVERAHIRNDSTNQVVIPMLIERDIDLMLAVARSQPHDIPLLPAVVEPNHSRFSLVLIPFGIPTFFYTAADEVAEIGQNSLCLEPCPIRVLRKNET